MKLHSPRLEQRLRRQVKRTIRGSPELRREARRTNRARHLNSRPLFRLVISGVVAGLTWSIAARTNHPVTALAFVGLWLLAWIPFQVQSLAHHLYASTDLSALSLLPIPARVVFRRQLGEYLRSASWLLVDLVAMLGALALWSEIPPMKWIVLVPMVALAWLTMLALVGLAMVHCPWLPYPLISTVLTLTVFVLFLVGSVVGPALLAALDASAGTLRLVLPTMWPLALFQCLRTSGDWLEILFLIPTLGLIWTLQSTRARLAAGYEFGEPLHAEPTDVLPEQLASGPEDPAEAPRRVGLTTIEEFIETRGFLSRAGWPESGWFEARLWRWLTSRERELAEFVFPLGIKISRPWSKTFLHLAIGGASGFALGWVNPVFQFWAWLGTMLLTAFRALACFYTQGRAFTPLFCSGVNIQLHAAYPIGYRELSWVLFKYSLVQLPLLAGWLVLCGAALAQLVQTELLAGVVIGFKIAFLLAAARFIFVTLAFSAGTNDSSRLRLRTFVLVGVILFLGLGFVALGVAGILVKQPLVAVALWMGAMLVGWCFWRSYGWFYDANRFDVMSLPQQQL